MKIVIIKEIQATRRQQRRQGDKKIKIQIVVSQDVIVC
jgi:hypothetical protein